MATPCFGLVLGTIPALFSNALFFVHCGHTSLLFPYPSSHHLTFQFWGPLLKASFHKTFLFFSCFRDVAGSPYFSSAAASPLRDSLGLSGSLELLHGPKGACAPHLKSIPVLAGTAAGGAEWT